MHLRRLKKRIVEVSDTHYTSVGFYVLLFTTSLESQNKINMHIMNVKYSYITCLYWLPKYCEVDHVLSLHHSTWWCKPYICGLFVTSSQKVLRSSISCSHSPLVDRAINLFNLILFFGLFLFEHLYFAIMDPVAA